MQRPYFTFHKEWRDAAKDLPVDIRAEIYEAIIEYALSGEIPVGMKPIVGAVFKFVKERIDTDAERYKALCERNRTNGAKSKGRPKNEKPKETQENPKKPKKPTGLSTENEKNADSSEIPYNIDSNGELIQKPTGLFGLFDEEFGTKKDIPPTPPIEKKEAEEEKATPKRIVDFYNQLINDTPGCKIRKCIKMTDKRKELINARLKDFGADKVKEAIKTVVTSRFCNGEGSQGWIADFDFVFNVNSMPKILEGKYDDRLTDSTQLHNNNTGKFKDGFSW